MTTSTGLPYVPETITVHLGTPDDTSAPNVTVPFLEYIQNVASSELYPTWPENALRANIYAQVSFALNRIYTEWYRSRGYDFDITSSTAYDQSYVNGRDIFENVALLVNDLFDQYLSRPGYVQPLFSAYCDGRRVQCDGLSQWGTVELAQQGMTPYEILNYYYGDNLDIRTAPVLPLTTTYPGQPLRLGDIGNAVELLQTRLNRISNNYPSIPKIYPVDGIFTRSTEDAVKAFQRIFGLTPDGIVGPATWYQINSVFNGVARLSELDAEGLTLEDVTSEYQQALREGDSGNAIRLLQYYLNSIGTYNDALPTVAIDGIFGTGTRDAVIAFQRYSGLTPDGLVGEQTWDALVAAYDETAQSQRLMSDVTPLPPAMLLVLGSRSDAVYELQGWLNRVAQFYPEIQEIPQTGYFGDQTRNAVLAFQELYGVPVTGVVDPLTFFQIEQAARDLERGT